MEFEKKDARTTEPVNADSAKEETVSELVGRETEMATCGTCMGPYCCFPVQGVKAALEPKVGR